MVTMLSITWAILVAALLVRAVIQYRSYEMLDPVPLAISQVPAFVTVVIPARNEGANIGRCLKSLLEQKYPCNRMEIVVVDDNSTDCTAGVVRELASTQPQLRLINGSALPGGWTGKPFACWQGARAAGGEWLCFLDADTVASPELLGTSISVAEQRRYDLMSLEPFQQLGSFWERTILPAGFLLLAFFHDLRRTNDPKSCEATANGQFILIRRAVYEFLGGHKAVRSEICEDKALAALVKRAGGRIALIGAEKLIQTRMYRGLGSLWEGLSKNLAEMIGTTTATAMVGAAAFAIAWTSVLLPLQAWPERAVSSPSEWAAFAISLMASLALLGAHIGTARHFRIPWWYGLLFPISYTMGAILAFNSIRVRMCGRVAWKGRYYQTERGVLHS